MPVYNNGSDQMPDLLTANDISTLVLVHDTLGRTQARPASVASQKSGAPNHATPLGLAGEASTSQRGGAMPMRIR